MILGIAVATMDSKYLLAILYLTEACRELPGIRHRGRDGGD
jgi:hypothetical protein